MIVKDDDIAYIGTNQWWVNIDFVSTSCSDITLYRRHITHILIVSAARSQQGCGSNSHATVNYVENSVILFSLRDISSISQLKLILTHHHNTL